MAEELKVKGGPFPIPEELRASLEKEGKSPEEIVGIWNNALQLWQGPVSAFDAALDDEGPIDHGPSWLGRW